MKTYYERLGGAAVVRQLVDRFYELMDEDPEFYGIRKLHPSDMHGSRQKLFMFLSGWLGGPSLYIEQFGHPRLRARHLPFSITGTERDQWIDCMRRAMTNTGIDVQLSKELTAAFFQTADFMRNTAD